MEIKIWLGDLGAYNEGRLVGEWLTLPMDPEELDAKVKQYSRGGDGDYFIADSECALKGIRIGESSDPLALNETAEKLADLNDHDQQRVAYLLDNGIYNDSNDALDNYDDVTFYEGMTMKQVAEQMIDDGCFGDIPESIANYIDYDALARDISHDGYDETPEGVFHYNR